jgi:hypothetical protein
MLARQELAIEFGWKWRSSYRDLTPRPAPKMVVNNNPRPALPPPPQPKAVPKTRPVPKL